MAEHRKASVAVVALILMVAFATIASQASTLEDARTQYDKGAALFQQGSFPSATASLADAKPPVANDLSLIVARLRAKDKDAPNDMHEFVIRNRSEALERLLPFAKDADANVRLTVTIELGGIEDDRVVPLLETQFNDSDRHVRGYALKALLRRPRSALAALPPSFVDRLAEYAAKWGDGSAEAILLLGDLGARRKMSHLRDILEQAEQIKGIMDYRYALVPRMKDAVIKALFKLGDQQAALRVKDALQGEDVPRIVFGVQAVVYAGRKDYVPYLLALLDDVRDGENIAPSGTEFYLRVRDLTINAVHQITKADFGFRIERGLRYTNDQAKAVHACLRKR